MESSLVLPLKLLLSISHAVPRAKQGCRAEEDSVSSTVVWRKVSMLYRSHGAHIALMGRDERNILSPSHCESNVDFQTVAVACGIDVMLRIRPRAFDLNRDERRTMGTLKTTIPQFRLSFFPAMIHEGGASACNNPGLRLSLPSHRHRA